LANADILPFDFAFYADNIRQFIDELQKKSDPQKHFDFKPLLERVVRFESEGQTLNRAIGLRLQSGNLDVNVLKRLNEKIMRVEANWLNADGIPGRPWFKHVLYAARYTYAHLELPGLTEAIERADWKVASQQSRIVEGALDKNAALLRAASEEISK